MRLLLLLITVPIIELYLLIQLAQAISWPYTIALTILTGIAGAMIATRQRVSAIRRVTDDINSGRVPTAAMLDVIMIFAAGLLLMIPGVLTDLIGATLLIPVCRAMYRNLLIRWFRKNVRGHITVGFSPNSFHKNVYRDDTVIDSYAVEKRNQLEVDD